MMAIPDHEALFVSTPKNCTNSTYQTLRDNFNVLEIEPLYHNNHIPDRIRHFFTFTVIRNPYARAVSLWRKTRTLDKYQKEAATGDWETFGGFMRFLLTRPDCFKRRYLHENQTDWLRDVRIDYEVRFERYERALRAIPFWREGKQIDPPKLNASDYDRPWYEYVDDEAASLVRQWAGPDFDNYGYSREVPRAAQADG